MLKRQGNCIGSKKSIVKAKNSEDSDEAGWR